MMTSSGRVLAGVFAMAAVACMAVCTSSPVSGQSESSWTLGTVDQSFVWSPQTNVVPQIDACAAAIVKAKGPWTQTGSQVSPGQICLLRTMRSAGASTKAMAFSRWYYATQDSESVWIGRLYTTRFGLVSIASIEFPGRANNNWSYIFVNGAPAIVNADAAFAATEPPWKNNATFAEIEKAHPNAWVFPQEDFAGESALRGGGQRFTIAVPIVDGCHACARLGIVYLGYDFGRNGSARGVSVTAVHHCPSSDTRCKRL